MFEPNNFGPDDSAEIEADALRTLRSFVYVLAVGTALAFVGSVVQWLDGDPAGVVLGAAAVFGLGLSWYLTASLVGMLHGPDDLSYYVRRQEPRGDRSSDEN